MADERTDVLVIGCGIAGLVFALNAAERASVTVLTKKKITYGNTWFAQGGIAVAVGAEDSPDKHWADTIVAGADLSRRSVVRSIVEAGERAARLLESYGVAFNRSDDGSYELGREGAHGERRVLHVHDATGHAIMEALVERARRHPRVRILEGHLAVDLILESRAGGDKPPGPDRRYRVPGEPVFDPEREDPFGVEARDRVLGAFVLRQDDRTIRPFLAKVTMLATGGCGKVYRYTSNSDAATGDGVAMAYRAGARVANLEFVQFHPTCLYHEAARTFLISEAVRGEGGYLTSLDGDRFMTSYDERGDLASRDIVARAIDRELKRRNQKHVQLHMEHMGHDAVRERFPVIYETCRRYGIRVEEEPIPVVPAAHYMCGGVVTDLAARTDLMGLLAAGEVACTGLHGANRLASNSLLEGTVLGAAAAETAEDLLRAPAYRGPVPEWDPGSAVEPKESVLVGAHWDMVRAVMWNFVGILRRDNRLDLASQYMRNFRQSIERYYRDFLLDLDLVELRNLALVADLIVTCARGRKESRGLHANEDHSDRNDAEYQADSVVDPTRGVLVEGP